MITARFSLLKGIGPGPLSSAFRRSAHLHTRNMANAVPVILCGLREEIGGQAIENLKPEFDVVQFVMSRDSGCAQIPLLLKGQSAPSDSELGSKDLSKPPMAVICGGGYDDEAVAAMMKASEGSKDVPWLRPDLTKPAPPLGPEYGKAMGQRVKDKLNELVREGALDEAKVYWY